MARYLVTGGAGFIGSHLVDSLLADGHTVRVLDDLSTGTRRNLDANVDLQIADVSTKEAVREALDGVDGCFHLAAIASVERGRREWLRTHNVNLSATINVFDEVRQIQNLKRTLVPLVYASSAAVYGESLEGPIPEHAPTNPINAYGVDKLGCDWHAEVGRHIHDLRIVGLRFFNIYGPRQDPRSPYSGVISIFCERISKGLPVKVYGDGQQVRDFVFIEDTVRALRLAMRSARSGDQNGGIFNVCSGTGTSINALGAAICTIQGRPFSAEYLSPRPGDIRVSIGNPTLAEQQLKFRTRVSLAEGLARTLEWLS